ncbi:MAG: FAD-dependent oxidoreductase [Desulfobacterales bacterium]|jgi:NADPH-dependent glutamate synthase beta subunit-like oxidoreductase/NAD-dependent dihydropyrimidine dehydrogenase PreA subunit
MSEKHVLKENTTAPPCQCACPAGIDVPRYIRRIKEGKLDEALAVIRERIPFPSVCGFACYAPCEGNCGNRQFGEPIAIRALKRAAAEKGGDLWFKNLTIAPESGKQAAVVGSGPSGLSAAYYLATLGHKVTVFEALEETGGMMRVGIPAYRLPREALDQEIDYLKEVGVAIKTGYRVESADQLLKEGFDAVYFACGAHQGAKLGISGDDLPGVVDGISFLREVNQDQTVEIGNRIAVIGGGNTAIDAARSAIRLGVKEVNVFYRRTSAEMTAYEEEVGAAIFEGVAIEYLTTPVSVAQKNGNLEVTFTRMELGKPDASGRPSPVPVEGSEFTKTFDNVITAVGQVPVGTQSFGVALGRGDFVQVDAETLATDKAGVYAGGDVVSGPASIIEAIAQGRKAAASMDKFLGGAGVIDQDLAPPEEEIVVMDYQADDQARVSMPCISLDERTCSFAAVEVGLSRDLAIKEAERCRGCDARQYDVQLYGQACKECSYCVEVCGLDVFGPASEFNEKGYRPMEVQHPERCIGCLACFYACPDFSIDVSEKESA